MFFLACNFSGLRPLSLSGTENELIAGYEREVAGAQDGEGHYPVTSSYEVVTDTDRYLSLRVNTTVVMAGGAEHVKIFTIGKSTGDVVSPRNLFRDKEDLWGGGVRHTQGGYRRAWPVIVP